MRLIDADALVEDLEKVYEFYMNEIKEANENPGNYTSKFLPATAGAIDGLVDAEIVINNAPTIEPFTDNISRSQAIKGVSEWATDILHPDRLVKEDAIHILESLPSAEQVTGKLKNPCESLLTADSEACKEQKSKLDTISRQDALAEFRDGRDVYDIMESIEELPSAETPIVLEKHQLSEETPTNTSTDLISRQDAVNEIHKYFVEEIEKTPTEIDEDGDELYADMPTVNSLLACNKELSKRIKSLPSAPDSRQRGEWVYGIDDETGEKDCYPWTCSVCNKEYPWQPNYCPNCGADMRGEEE